jgi:hypothetical protein
MPFLGVFKSLSDMELEIKSFHSLGMFRITIGINGVRVIIKNGVLNNVWYVYFCNSMHHDLNTR